MMCSKHSDTYYSHPMTSHRMHTRFEVVMVRLLRLGVLALGFTVPLSGDVLDRLGNGHRLLAITSLWSLWGIALLCILVPASSTLTALRLTTPTHVSILILVVIAAGIDTGTTIALAASAIIVVVSASAEIGAYFIQSSAYGDERRFPLRCPRPFLAVLVFAWLIWFASATVGSILVVGGNLIGTLLVAVALAGFVLLPRRFHRYSRRWLVSVPAGLVIHDHVVLTETAMFPTRQITSIDLWSRASSPDDEPFDVSGGLNTSGVVVHLADPETVILAPTKDHPGGQAFHVRSARLCPSRIGRTIASLTSTT